MVRLVSLSVLLTLIVVLGVTFFKVVAPFILPLFLAAVFAILCQPIYLYFLERTNQRIRLASGLTAGAVVSVILVPLVVGTILASLQLFVVATDLSDRNLGRTLRERTDPILQYVADFVNARTTPQSARDEPEGNEEPSDSGPEDTEPAAEDEGVDSQPAGEADPDDGPAADAAPAEDLALQTEGSSGNAAEADPSDADVALPEPRAPPVKKLTAADMREQLQTWIRDWLAQMGSKSLGMAGGTFDLLSGSVVAVGSTGLAFVIFAVSLYYFLADGTQLVRATERLIPVHVEYQRQMLNQFSKVVRAVVMATFFAALAQALATVAALWLLDFDHLFIVFILALLMSMIPMMGTWLVWLPCAGYLMYNGHWFQALLLSVYGAAFIGMLDNVVRTYILNTDVKLHPLLALISVLGGLQVMGLWGMFVGPIVASCLHALVKIFNHELTALSKEKFAGLDDAPAASPADGAAPPTPPSPTVANDADSGQNGSSTSSGESSPRSES